MRHWLTSGLVACVCTGLAAQAPTWSDEIAAVVFTRCSPCHRPGQSAPFALLDHDDLARRRRQIQRVVERRLMPPWLPHPDVGEFEGERRLSDEERNALLAWIDADCPEGDPDAVPEQPEWVEGWQLGAPDLVIELAESFEVPAEGPDLFRNFVIATPVETTRYVRAFELWPGNSRAVHHAIVQVDGTDSCRELADADPGPGFAGMTMGNSEPPDGHFLGWTPGKVAREVPEGMAWRVQPGDDFVIQLHMTPTGKPEAVRPRIGLYFTERAPTRQPYSIVLYREDIDIPAGAGAHVVTDRYTLPTDVDVLGVYPHAHYLGRTMRADAKLPDGSSVGLLRIDEWDFDWQDDYRLARPVRLPAGTEIDFHYTFDNTADNPRNPNRPPQRVTFGPESDDEMATLTLQVVPVDPEARPLLDLARWRRATERRPEESHAWNELGRALMAIGDAERALAAFKQSLICDPSSLAAMANLGTALRALGHSEEARGVFEVALDLRPDDPVALQGLGVLAAQDGDFERAVELLERALEQDPSFAEAHIDLANVFAFRGDGTRAREHYSAALRIRPRIPEAHNNIANTWLVEGSYDLAVASYRAALALRPDYFNARLNLGRALIELGQGEAARIELAEALRLRPDDPTATELMRRAR